MTQTDDVTEIFSFTEKIIDSCGARLAGDPSTRKAAEMIRDEFATHCDSVALESFVVHPNAFLGQLRLLATIYPIVVICLWLKWPLIAALGLSFGFLALVSEAIFYREYLDRFWKKKQGTNVIGIIEPTAEVKQQIVVSAHHDSAYIFNFLSYKPILYPILSFGALFSIIYVLFMGWLWVFMGANASLGFQLFLQISATLVTPLVVVLWFFRANTGTPGAGDNLISVAILSQLGKKFAKEKLKHTRLILASFDAEEAGLRGARAYCKKHKDDLLNIPTFDFNMDSPYTLKDLAFLTKDINGTVHLSEEMADECVSIAKSLGYKAKAFPIPFLIGGTDAGEFGRVGVAATNLSAMSIDTIIHEATYHTPNDTIDAIEPAAVEAAFKIASTFIQKKDKKIP